MSGGPLDSGEASTLIICLSKQILEPMEVKVKVKVMPGCLQLSVISGDSEEALFIGEWIHWTRRPLHYRKFCSENVQEERCLLSSGVRLKRVEMRYSPVS